MNKIYILIFVLAVFRLGFAEPAARPGEYVVKLRESKMKDLNSLKDHLSAYGMRVKQSLDLKGSLKLIKMESDADSLASLGLAKSASALNVRAAVLRDVKKLSEIELIEPNYLYYASFGSKPSPTPAPTPAPTPPPVATDPEEKLPSVIPHDPMFASLWGMRNMGQNDSAGKKGVVGADIDANNAWAITTGSRSVIVAVVDSGVDYNHPDLKANMWSLPGQPNVHGYNAIKNSLDPMDDNEHGTHCAGTIGAVGDNDVGVVGVNWKVSIMAIKFLDSSGSGALSDAIKGIDWAIAHGAQVMNNSWGGGPFSQSLMDAINRARSAGILFVAAAGNTTGGHDNDVSPSYPASYKLDNIIAVAALNNRDQLSSFSHYGAKTVHIGAPGENILSTIPDGKYDSFSGTSMASPHVAGAAALLLSKEPSLSYLQLKSRLLGNADKISALSGRVSSGGRLNILKALSPAN
jgi:subtilisin family serine protease